MSDTDILISGGQPLAPPEDSNIISLEDFAGHNSAEVLRVDGDTELAEIVPHLEKAKTIIVKFPAFTDGRGFSLGRILRQRAGFKGELIAEGPLIPDQYAYAIQCGYSAVKLDSILYERHSESHWFKALSAFGLTYQRGYAVHSGPATSILDARKTGFRDAETQDDPFHGLSAEMALKKACEAYEGQIVLASSLGVDSVVLLHMVSKIDPNLPVIFLDTGKHFRETLAYRDLLIEDLGLTNFQNIRPDPNELQSEDPTGDLHKSAPDSCCDLRKVRPLDKVIRTFSARITGRKRYQTPQRANMKMLETGGDQIKVNPLAYWSAKDVTDYIRRHDLPPHPMLALGYLSIGCQPCTTRVAAGEDPRAGRWRHSDKTECGIHFIDGKWEQVPTKKSYEVF
ncbi:phosphoadenylyl-sulfate reductase (thioredoxin) [Litorimonas taeanensis]|uniref:Adenosine 5'-phosphosulfate reductase n=1 Tax=Litorimonas taeanensis TaxID=568099 RepID=A0A420WK60_9PROT|nr:phosphoadenylyl-sulfate reductase [Litorimonas taeanensis]RKQ71390.1 phosphoadenylyl-sulfate reductase (thioredoxin) [Litorimonas taeanensis]